MLHTGIGDRRVAQAGLLQRLEGVCDGLRSVIVLVPSREGERPQFGELRKVAELWRGLPRDIQVSEVLQTGEYFERCRGEVFAEGDPLQLRQADQMFEAVVG